jgi:hypothetical protein
MTRAELRRLPGSTFSVSPTPSRTVPLESEPFEPMEFSESELSELELSELSELELSELDESDVPPESLLELWLELLLDGVVVVADFVESACADPDFPLPAAIKIAAARSAIRTGNIIM